VRSSLPSPRTYPAGVPAPSVIKARVDLREGRPWRARQRLESFVSQNPTHQEALELLGDVLYEMGDTPRAGRYWLLTSRTDNRATAALRALRERYPLPEDVLAQLRVGPLLTTIPNDAQLRVERLRQEARTRGIEWTPGPGRLARKGARTTPQEHWWTAVVVVVVIGLVLAILVAGTIRLGELAVDLVRWLIGR